MTQTSQGTMNQNSQAASPKASPNAAQGADGKFKPGQSGNPKGRPLGSRNKVKAHVRAFLEDKIDDLLAVAWVSSGQHPKLALEMVKLIAGHDLTHPPEFKIGKIDSEADLDAAAQRAVDAADEGALSPAELTSVLSTLEKIRGVKGWGKPENVAP